MGGPAPEQTAARYSWAWTPPPSPFTGDDADGIFEELSEGTVSVGAESGKRRVDASRIPSR